MVSFYTPWKYQKTSGFLIFSKGMEREWKKTSEDAFWMHYVRSILRLGKFYFQWICGIGNLISIKIADQKYIWKWLIFYHIKRHVFWQNDRLILLYKLLTMWYISWRSFGFLDVIIYITTEIWGSPYNRAKIYFSLPCFSLWLYMFVYVYLFVGICLCVCISS